jgi:hypothetical protein
MKKENKKNIPLSALQAYPRVLSLEFSTQFTLSFPPGEKENN